MDTNQTIKELNELIQLDIDAIQAYDQAISNVSETNVKQQLETFKADHHRHVTELSDEVRKVGGQPPEFKRDAKGFLMQGFTAIRSATGTEGALKAMRMNEKLTNRNYAEAVKKNFPANIQSVVERNLADEQKHLSWIEDAIQRRLWEGAPARP